MADTPPTPTRLGPTAVRVEVSDPHQALELAGWSRLAEVGAGEVVPGARTVLFDDVHDVEALVARLAHWSPGQLPVEPGPEVLVPVVFDGADLGEVADHWDTDVDGVVARLVGTELVSAFCGFAPGFAYLAGLPAGLTVPRRDSPRPSVPAGSVALADGWCGIYPTASPGGWRLVGRTTATLWDPSSDAPALLAPGTRVRLVPA